MNEQNNKYFCESRQEISMKCSVYIATSADGYIATIDGDVDWLHRVGNLKADMGDAADMGFSAFISSVDCMIMGRKCMETISNMNLSPGQWPYGDTHIIVLSNSIKTPPHNLEGKVEMFSGEITDLLKNLESKGFKHAYVDGGATITSFLNLRLIDKIIITKAPILLGKGIPLFGELDHHVKLIHSKATVFANDFIQIEYTVKY